MRTYDRRNIRIQSRRYEFRIQTDDSRYGTAVVAYEPETEDSFGSVEIPEITIRPQDLDGLIVALLKIRREIKFGPKAE